MGEPRSSGFTARPRKETHLRELDQEWKDVKEWRTSIGVPFQIPCADTSDFPVMSHENVNQFVLSAPSRVGHPSSWT